MSRSKTTAVRAVVALVAVAVIVSAVTVGGVARTDAEHSAAADGNAEPNGSMQNAAPVEYGEEIRANLSSPDDVDYYAVNASAGDAILPRLRLKNAVAAGAIQVDVIAPDGEVTTELQNDVIDGPYNNAGPATMGGGDAAYTGDVMESNGTYYVRVMEADNTVVGGTETNASDTYRYSLTVNRTAVDAREPNENGTTATPVEVGETVEAAFAGYDSDVYAVNLAAGESYTVEVSHPADLGDEYATKTLYAYANRSQPVDDPAAEFAEDGKSPYDFRRPNGTAVAVSETIRTGTESVSFAATKDGTHYLQIVQDQQNYNLVDLDEYAIAVTRTDGAPSGDDGETPQPPDDGEDDAELPADGDGHTDDCELVDDEDPTGPDTDDRGTPAGREG